MQKYALRKVITPSEKDQNEGKQWKAGLKDSSKSGHPTVPVRSTSRLGEHSRTILNNNNSTSINSSNKTNSLLRRQNKNSLHSTNSYLFSSNNQSKSNYYTKKNEIQNNDLNNTKNQVNSRVHTASPSGLISKNSNYDDTREESTRRAPLPDTEKMIYSLENLTSNISKSNNNDNTAISSSITNTTTTTAPTMTPTTTSSLSLEREQNNNSQNSEKAIYKKRGKDSTLERYKKMLERFEGNRDASFNSNNNSNSTSSLQTNNSHTNELAVEALEENPFNKYTNKVNTEENTEKVEILYNKNEKDSELINSSIPESLNTPTTTSSTAVATNTSSSSLISSSPQEKTEILNKNSETQAETTLSSNEPYTKELNDKKKVSILSTQSSIESLTSSRRQSTSKRIDSVVSRSSVFSTASTASKRSLSPSFRTLDELQAKLQSTLEDGDRILEENELECLKQENTQLNIEFAKLSEENRSLRDQVSSFGQLEKEFTECMVRLKKMTMVVNAKEREVQELSKEREKDKETIYRMRERTTDLVTKNNELFNSKLKLKYELEYIKEQMEAKTQELERVTKERDEAKLKIEELSEELENDHQAADDKRFHWAFRPFGL